MFDIFSQLSKLIKVRSVCIDNNVFTLHYRLSVLLLFSFCLIIGSRKYFGDPIDCTHINADKNIVDTYCWFNSYIVVPRNPSDNYDYHHEHVHPVINTEKYSAINLRNPQSKYKAYYLHAYQWIEFILFGQAVLFFLPRYLWRYCWEQGRVKALTEDFTLVTLKPTEKHKSDEIVAYFKRNKLDHFEYAWKFIICEILNFVNVAVQLAILQRMFSLDWSTLAEDFFSSDSNVNPHHPLNRLFPNVAKCDVPTFGGSSHGYLGQYCVLPVNVFVTKIYIFLWFYLYALLLIDGLALVHRLATLFSTRFRTIVLNRLGKRLPKECGKIVKDLTYGDWFVLCLVGKNIDPFSFEELVKGFGEGVHISRPSFASIASEKLYNPDVTAMHLKRGSMKNFPSPN